VGVTHNDSGQHYDAGLHIDTISFGQQNLYKYSEGLDRKQGPWQVGTLLLILNSEDLQGGALVADDSRTVVDQPGAWLVFLPLDVPHHVTRVEWGERYVFTAPVFGVWVTTRDDNAARAPWRPYED